MTDFSANCVLIFSNRGQLLYKFRKRGEGIGDFALPARIELYKELRIIVASTNPDHCIQLF